MWQILKQKHSLVVRRDDVMRLMAELDPCGTENRFEHGVFPKRLRTDCGTENGIMAVLHCTLRSEHTDEFAGAKSHMYGTSTSNQRIESWWSYFRKQRKDSQESQEYKLYWNTHTIRPVHQSRCPSGKPEAMYHVPQRFDGNNCGFPAPAQTLNHITSIMPVPATPAGDEHETLFGELQRQSALILECTPGLGPDPGVDPCAQPGTIR
ncbi:uncharacterized protein LOC127532017 [Scomber scombrus]|uniref:Uncharacterized protein LOC127532017 n=1 Tax=Scomber scombrus TaxID=13677 RepID=A0AAV1NEY2_SCOSC